MSVSIGVDPAGMASHDWLARAMRDDGLRAVFQPLVCLDSMSVMAYEGLCRPTDGDAGPGILELLILAGEADVLADLELRAAQQVCRDFSRQAGPGRLLVNLSPKTVLCTGRTPATLVDLLAGAGGDPSRITLELTERDLVEDVRGLAEVLAGLRARGMRVALDDFGKGHANFEMWRELRPEMVKIDRYLVNGIAGSAEKLAIVRALCSVAEALGTKLVGEGVETVSDLRLLRELGISFAQGYLLGRPQSAPAEELGPAARAAISSARLLPPVTPPSAQDAGPWQASHVAIMAPSLDCRQLNDEVARIFSRHPELATLAVTDDGRPLGLVNRQTFLEQMARPYSRELFGRKPCTTFMQEDPLLVDEHQPLDALSDVFHDADQRYLVDGFIVTRNGRYLGLGTGQALLRRVTELRIEAARYANPLTFLPGNIPITAHVDALMREGAAFVAAYVDLNDFKPFNDHYGYFRGDEMIRLLATILVDRIESRRDFAGHIGGDDFMIIFRSEDWRQRCLDIVSCFNGQAGKLFDEKDRAQGGIAGEDRRGIRQMFGLTTVSIGAVCVPAGAMRAPEFIATLAAQAKHRAKQARSGFHVMDQDTFRTALAVPSSAH